ncbi:DUF3060 domain-containing protein [Granulosicoccus antarcticus]|uniref:Uncharacterized protein n=1 Tax=Granulosicoccus antarcticus IMCC3135 TaxID=1192854 RepID=A0A2Z2NP34_9GAMM|nr:DUF3060 domain-containing protein [Granulosicoccus antarcticus]ASJ73242.1 hypothetical protein IMCC3135_15800 [Granulosicoccus antarcticus IMCC3135]
MKNKTLSAAMIFIACTTTVQTPLFAQTTLEYGCDDRLNTVNDNSTIRIHGNCDEIWLPGNDITVTFDSAREIKIAGNNNTVTQSGTTDGSAVSLWIGGDKNVATINRVSKIVLAGDKNRVSHYGGNRFKPALMGHGNKVVIAKGSYPVAANGNKQSKPPTRQQNQAKNEPQKNEPQKNEPQKNEPQKKPVKTDSSAAPLQTTKKSPDLRNVVDVLFLGQLNKYDILVLYKDNTARFNPATPVDYLDVTADKKNYPKHWRQWRREGKRIQVRGISSTGKWFNLRDSTPVSMKPAQENLRLSGEWSNFWTNSDYTATGSSHYWLSKDGRFKTSSSSMMGASVPGISSTIAASSCDSSGDSSIVNSTATSGSSSISKKGNKCGAANVGEYKIDDYSIVLNAEDGKVYRRTFYRLDNKTILIRGRYYAIKE